MAADAPPLGADEKLRFPGSWLKSLATCSARVSEPLASGDAPPRLQQLMLDRLAQPQFWVAALTIATRQHAQLLRLSANSVELEAGAESLATGEQVIQWYGRAGPGDWPLHRLKVHIPVAAMAYLCAARRPLSMPFGRKGKPKIRAHRPCRHRPNQATVLLDIMCQTLLVLKSLEELGSMRLIRRPKATCVDEMHPTHSLHNTF